MKKYEFEELKNRYYTITEAIALYDSGNHSEYDEDDLNDELDNIHVEICEAASDIAQYLINKIDNDYNGAKVEMSKEDLDNIHYLNSLYDWACACRDYCEEPEYFDLTKSYGSGLLDSIGADFYIGHCRRSEYKYFGYSEFLQLLEKYELITD